MYDFKEDKIINEIRVVLFSYFISVNEERIPLCWGNLEDLQKMQTL